MIFQLHPLFIVLEKPGYIALWVPSVQHPDVFWAYWGGGVPLFYYFTVQLHLLYVCGMCGKSKISFITFRFLSLLS